VNFFLGCDVAKAKLDVSLVNEQGIEQWADIVPNTITDLVGYLAMMHGHYSPDDVITCVVESTGCYHYPLLDATAALSIPCIVYNPIITKQQIKASVRGKKTDRTDATMIARLGLRGEGRIHTIEPYRTIKHRIRSYQKLGNLGMTLRRHTTHMTEQLEQDLTTAMQEAFTAVQERITEARIVLYRELTASASGPLFTRLQTIPGIGPYVAASLIGEIQDIKRFASAHALVAYAGLDPKIRQSGHTLNNTGRLTKRGSSHLRRSVFIAASVARQHDPNMKALYDKKREEGKPYTVATIVVARKILTIVRAVWLSEKDYDVRFCVEDEDRMSKKG
jgi:transposase